jgi:hypothetical protein
MPDELSRFELLSLIISLLAAALSAIALIWSRRTATKQLELQQQQADFARFQHKVLAREQQAQARADLRATFTKQGRHFKFRLTNEGPSTARYIRIAGINGDACPDPFIASEFDRVVPIPELRPGQDVWLIAAIHMGTALPVPLLLTWSDESADNQQQELRVQIAG